MKVKGAFIFVLLAIASLTSQELQSSYALNNELLLVSIIKALIIKIISVDGVMTALDKESGS